MALGKLPRIQRGIPIVDAGGRALDYFLRLLGEAFTMIERNEASQDSTIAAIQALQAQQALQLDLINQALELAGIAIGLAGGNTGTSTATIDIPGVVWTPGPQVDLTGVVAGDVSVSSSGLYPDSGTTFNQLGERLGSVRLVEIDGVTETVIGGPWQMKVEKDAIFGTVFVLNASELNTFSMSRSTTGSIGYRIEYSLDEPLDVLDNVPAKMFVRRSV